ncbi:hypothetical protein ACJ73_09988, partial [Blastomyces percursus]
MLRTTPIGPLVREAALEPAEALLATRQLRYAARLLGLPKGNPASEILPITLREGDVHAQPGEQPVGDREWAEPGPRGPWALGVGLARQLGAALRTDPSEGFEQTVQSVDTPVLLTTRVLGAEEALAEALGGASGTRLWSDGSRLEDGRTGAGVAYKPVRGPWRTRMVPLGAGKE